MSVLYQRGQKLQLLHLAYLLLENVIKDLNPYFKSLPKCNVNSYLCKDLSICAQTGLV